MKLQRRVPRIRKPDCDIGGLLPPTEMFDRVLPGGRIIDGHLRFEERVQRAWRHIAATRFTPDENEQLREAFVALITAGNL